MKAVITHCYSDSNKGDLGMLMATIEGLRRLRPEMTITLQSLYPVSHEEFEYHTRSVRALGLPVEGCIIPSPYVDENPPSAKRNLAALLRLARGYLGLLLCRISPRLGGLLQKQQEKSYRSLQSADIVIAKGGHYLYNDQGGLRAWLYIWRLLTCIRVPILMNKPTILLGHSIGPIYGGNARRMAQDILSRCNSIVVREQRSGEVFAELGIRDNVTLAPDLAFLIEPAPPEIPAFFANHNAWIAVSINNWIFPESAAPATQKKRYVDGMIETLCEANRRWNLRPVFFLQEFVRQHGSSDVDLVESMVAELRDRGVHGEVIEDDLWPSELSYLYGLCRVTLATRFHSCIYSALAGTPVIAIRYQGFKTEGVMADAGMERFVHDIDDIHADRILEQIDEILEHRPEYSAKVLSYAQTASGELRACFERLISPYLPSSGACVDRKG